jgi:hypothetical protein
LEVFAGAGKINSILEVELDANLELRVLETPRNLSVFAGGLTELGSKTAGDDLDLLDEDLRDGLQSETRTIRC